jgi:uncharacterized repeat protein (TIGR03803 family)
MKKFFLILFTLHFSLFTLCKAQYTVLHKFNDTLGGNPYGSLTLTGDTLFGMTSIGGKYNAGIIFSIKTDGSGFTDLHDFKDTTIDGGLPRGSLILSGNILYGMTKVGGEYYTGTIFSIQKDGSGFTILHDFNDTQGYSPIGSLLLSNNTLYGMTWLGGAYHSGTIFSVNKSGANFTKLHDFNDTDGSVAVGSLIISGTTLYGMVVYGCVDNYGEIFSINTDGSNYTVLHPCPGRPVGTLTQLGNILYGVATSSGGGPPDTGMVFSIQTDGANFTDLHDFNVTQGANSGGSLSLNGNTLYGMTLGGGVNGAGVIYSLWTNGSNFKVLHNFKGSAGENPTADLTLSNNTLFGMTDYGGYDSCYLCGYGVIFKDSIGPLGLNEPEIEQAGINIYPDPNKGIFQLSFPMINTEENGKPLIMGVVDFYNILGKMVASLPCKLQGNMQVNLSNQPNGLYLYRIIDPQSNLISSGKFIIVR